MDRESTILLQQLDSNCNDCKFMVRRNDRLEQAKKNHRHWCAQYLVNLRRYFWGEILKERTRDKDTTGLERERARVTVNKVYMAGFNFGDCTKFNRPVEFLPNTIQLDTQDCFEHRRAIATNAHA